MAILRADGSAIRYDELERGIDRMAAYATRLGLRAGDIAGLNIGGPDEALALVLYLALARLGIAVSDPAAPPERLKLSFQQKPEGAAAAPGLVGFDASWLRPRPGEEPAAGPIHPGGEALCQVVASSGTTGMPKHIPVSHALLRRKVLAWSPGDEDHRAVRIIAMSLSGAWGMACAMGTFWSGGTIVLSNPADAGAAIARHGVTSIITSPIALQSLLDGLPEGAGPFPSLRSIEVGGSLLPEPLHARAVSRLCPHMISIFGSSEAAYIASAPFAALTGRPGLVGQIYPGVTVEAVDADFTPLPPGSEGNLRIRSELVAEGYLWSDETASGGFQDGWFYSGDVGTVWPDGMLSLSGRISDLINHGGMKISPVPIEAALLRLPGVLDAAAFGMLDTAGIEQVWAAIAVRGRIDDAVLNAFCARALPTMAPKIILQMPALPRNENGKVVRRKLVELAAQMQREQAES